MKRSTVIYQQIGNHNAGDIILHLHRLWCRNPKNCSSLLKKLPYEKIKPIERRVSQQFWWVYRGFEFETFLREMAFDLYCKFTELYDERGTPIYVGDTLKSRYGYKISVVVNSDGDYVGKLLCESGHSCENIPYSLNNGEGYYKIRKS